MKIPVKIKFLVSLCLCIPFFLSSGAYGEDIKLGVIDTQKIMTQSKAAQEAREVFAEELEEKNKLLTAKQQAVQDLQNEINQEGKDMSEDVYEEKTERLAREIKELKRMKNDMEEDLEDRDEELSQRLLQEIAEVVLEYSEKENYTMILERNTVVAADEAIDITDRIIQLYDSQN